MKKDSMNILKIWNEHFCLEKKFFNELYLSNYYIKNSIFYRMKFKI